MSYVYTSEGVTKFDLSGFFSGEESHYNLTLQPLSKGYLIVIAFVVWVLEHQINKDFRGPPGHQQGHASITLSQQWSHSFSVSSNLTRFFRLGVCASPANTKLHCQLAGFVNCTTSTTDNHRCTGADKEQSQCCYREASFVKGLLIQMKFNSTKLKSYSSTKQLHELLSNRTAHGGVSAAFGEIPC